MSNKYKYLTSTDMQNKWLSLVFIVFLFACPGIHAQESDIIEKIPNPKATGNGYISDPDDYLTTVEEDTLNRLLADLESTNTVQVAIVIVESIGDLNPKDFAYLLFNTWGIGQADIDNGLLILSVMDQRRTEFETGYGLEGVLPDVICYRIGMQQLVPFFREGEYGKGLIAAVKRIKEVLEDPSAAEEVTSGGREFARSKRSIPVAVWIYLALGTIISVSMLVSITDIIKGKEDVYDKYLSLRKRTTWLLAFLFPLPYLFIYLYSRYKMNRFRKMPRYSRVNGKPMILLDEKADDAFLSDGQLTEEEIGSIDYDVWVTEDQDDVMILRYTSSWSRYKKCPKCTFKTYYHDRSRVVKSATYTSTGKKEVIYKCKNCQYRDVSMRTIPRKTRSSTSSGGGSFSSGGGSSSWGGGSSGGGGAGVSW